MEWIPSVRLLTTNFSPTLTVPKTSEPSKKVIVPLAPSVKL